MAALVSLLIPAGGARSGPDDPWPPLSILECFASASGTTHPPGRCRTERGALWFFAREHLHPVRPYPFVYRYEVASGRLEPIPIDSAPERVRAGAREFESRPHDWRSVWRGDDRCSCGGSFRADSELFEVKPTALIGLADGEYRLYPLPKSTAAQVRRMADLVQYGLPWGGAIEEIQETYGERGPSSHLGPHVRVQDPARGSDLVYFGLAGGFSEGHGSFGGLAIFDLRSRSWTVHRPDLLLEVSVDELLRDFRYLWLGTAHHGEYGASGISGLVRFDPATSEFRSYTTANSAITGDLIHMLRAGGLRTLWIATDRGLSCFATEEGLWQGFLWREPRTKPGPWELVPADAWAAAGSCIAPPVKGATGRVEIRVLGDDRGTEKVGDSYGREP